MKTFRTSHGITILALAAMALPACNDEAVAEGEVDESVSELEAVPGAAQAFGPRARFSKMFGEADKDSDGKVTEVEARAAAVARFTEIDKNGDGYLEKEELIAMREARWAGKAGAAARGPGKRGFGKRGPGFLMADADGDGKISKDEAPPRMASRFDDIDADGDGYVTQDEVLGQMGLRGVRPGGPALRMDSDGDGKVSKDEFLDGHIDRLKKADADGDGAVTLEELSSVVKAKRGHFGARGRGPGKMRGMHGNHPGARFAEMDADQDGQLTKAEAEAAHKARFAEIDTNQDGVLEDAELTAHHEARRAERLNERFASLDVDGDGSLSRSEVPRFLADRFQTVDANGDGAVTLEEMKAAKPSRMGPGKHGPRILRMDSDNDGKITAEEFAQRHAGWFDRVDTNGDGVVKREEIRAGIRGMRGYGPRR